MDRFERTKLVLGEDAIDILSKKRVAIFGVGGVGGYVAEGLCRSGIGAIDIIDKDKVDITNINRQIIALESTIGKDKVDVCEERMLLINPDIKVTKHKMFYTPDVDFDFTKFDYVVDAIDTVTGKIGLIVNADKMGVKIISSMGTGNKIEPTMLTVSDIYKTEGCRLARVMRRELKKRGIKKLKTVYSKEESKLKEQRFSENGKPVVGSVSFVPPVAGFIIVSEIIKDLLNL